MLEGALPSCEVLGVQCVVGDIPKLTDAVIERALSGYGGYGVFCNVHVLMTARRQPELMQALQSAWAVFPDGAPIAWFQRRVGLHAARRTGGPDLMPATFDHGRAHGLRHVLFGSTSVVVEELSERMQRRYKGTKIVGVRAPSWGEEHDERLMDSVAAVQPHIVWCALGAPKQELWMARHAHELAPALVLGVGAAFDFHAGTRERAPIWMQRMGLEWLHRLASEPRRLMSRYTLTNTEFAVCAATQLARNRVAR